MLVPRTGREGAITAEHREQDMTPGPTRASDRPRTMVRIARIEVGICHEPKGSGCRVDLSKERIDVFLRQRRLPAPDEEDHCGDAILHGVELLIEVSFSRRRTCPNDPHRVRDFLI